MPTNYSPTPWEAEANDALLREVVDGLEAMWSPETARNKLRLIGVVASGNGPQDTIRLYLLRKVRDALGIENDNAG